MGDNEIVCPNCGVANWLGDGKDKCQDCGAPLFMAHEATATPNFFTKLFKDRIAGETDADYLRRIKAIY